MLQTVFSVICVLSTVWSIFAGTSADVAAALLDGAGRAVEVTLSLLGIMGLWSGVMTVLREAGTIGFLSKLLRPIMKLVFKEPREEAVACLTANFLGIGNAATPLGIEALKRFQGSDTTVSDDGVMLTVLCTSSFSAIPTTVLALRHSAGADIMFELIPAIWLVGMVGTIVSVIIVKLLCKIFPRRA